MLHGPVFHASTLGRGSGHRSGLNTTLTLPLCKPVVAKPASDRKIWSLIGRSVEEESDHAARTLSWVKLVTSAHRPVDRHSNFRNRVVVTGV